MNMQRETNRIFSDLSNRIIGCAIEVHRHLGPGLLEATYQQCLAHELHLNDVEFKIEHPLPVDYKGFHLDCGYRLDFLVENQIIVEIKSVEHLNSIHEAQLLTLRIITKLPTGSGLIIPRACLGYGSHSLQTSAFSIVYSHQRCLRCLADLAWRSK